MDITKFTETLLVLLIVIRCQFAEEMFKYAVVGSRIDLYCEAKEKFGVDWVFKNQTGIHSIYYDSTLPSKIFGRYSVNVSSNRKTTVLSAEKIDSTYGGKYEFLRGSDQRTLKSIRLVIITPTDCNSADSVSTFGNTSHELYCSFSVAQNNTSDDRWPTDLCANGEQWHCQILGNFTEEPLYFGCSASGRLFTEHAFNESSPSLRFNASHQCRPTSTSMEDISTSTLTDKQIILLVCVVAGGFTLLTILLAVMTAVTRNCWKRRPKERTGNTYQIENRQSEGMYFSIDDSPGLELSIRTQPLRPGPKAGPGTQLPRPVFNPQGQDQDQVYEEIPSERSVIVTPCVPSPYAIYSDPDSILKTGTGNDSPVDVGLYGEMQKGDSSIYSMCNA